MASHKADFALQATCRTPACDSIARRGTTPCRSHSGILASHTATSSPPCRSEAKAVALLRRSVCYYVEHQGFPTKASPKISLPLSATG